MSAQLQESGESVLRCATPTAWVEGAVAAWRDILVDHAACEKKAASTALALMFAYAEDRPLVLALSRLAREELRHFEQVHRQMAAFGIAYQRQKPGRYAQGLRAEVRRAEPGRRLDLFLMGALIEARSCERFRLLAPRLPAPLGAFYAQLAEAEARHFELYLAFARQAAPGQWQERLHGLAQTEAQLACQPSERLFLG